MNNKMKITKKTYFRKAKEFSIRFDAAWKKLDALHGKFKLTDAQIDALCEAHDTYVTLNNEVFEYCIKNGINRSDFCCDIVNAKLK